MTNRRIATFATLAIAAGLAALFAALVSAQLFTAPDGPTQVPDKLSTRTAEVVHQLPRVVVTGTVQRTQTAQIVELPRVVVTGRRSDASQTLMTQAERSAEPRS